MTKHTGFLAFLLACAGGCTTPPDTSTAPEATAANEARPVCTREYRLGSNLPVTVCSTPKTAAERQQMMDNAKNFIPASPTRPQAGG